MQGESVVGLRVGEERGVEIQAEPLVLGPTYPVTVILRPNLVSLDLFARFKVDRVQAKSVLAGDHAVYQIQVGAQLVGRPGLARIIARRLDASAGQAFAGFKTAYVVTLPAVQRNGNLFQRVHCLVGVDPEFRVTLLGQFVRLFGRLCLTHVPLISFPMVNE